MASIVEFREDSQGRTADQTVDERGTLQRTYTRSFWARVDDPRLGPGVILAHPELPLPWDLYVTDTDYDRNARVINRVPTHTDPYRWDIRVQYSTRPLQAGTPGGGGGGGHSDPFGGTAGAGTVAHPNPLFRRARFSCSSRDFQRPCSVDLTRNATYPTGQKVCNSAFEPFDPPIVHDCAALSFRVVKNYAFLPSDWFQYLDPKKVNSDTFCGFLPGTVKINSISATDVQNENEINYVEATFEFYYREIGWDERPLDQGFSRLVDGVARTILDGASVVSRPRLLDGFGNLLTDHVFGVPDPRPPVFLDGTVPPGRGANAPGPFITQPQKPFAIFGI